MYVGIFFVTFAACDTSEDPPMADSGPADVSTLDTSFMPDSSVMDSNPLLDSSGSDSLSSDAGTDVSAPLDAGTDAETPFDAGNDAGPMDVGTDAGPLAGYGEECTTDFDCESNLCLMLATESVCSRLCNLAIPNDCAAEETLCLPAGGAAVCYGPTISTGLDGDDANLSLNDCVTRTLRPLGSDSDLFQVRAATDEPIVITVDPGEGVDVQLDFYDGSGDLIGRRNAAGPAGLEGLRFVSWTRDSIVYVVVADAGSSISNPYRICVEPTTI